MKLKKIIVLMLLLGMMVPGAARALTWMDGYAAAVVRETKLERAKHGLNGLRTDPALTAAARVRAQEIAARFSHTRPDGSSWRTVSSAALGENIARGHKTPDRVIAAWMTSSGHRANMLRGSWGSMGAACVQANGVYYWVQLFGR